MSTDCQEEVDSTPDLDVLRVNCLGMRHTIEGMLPLLRTAGAVVRSTAVAGLSAGSPITL